MSYYLNTGETVETLTLDQVNQSAYAWGCGDMQPHEFLAVEDLSPRGEALGDRLQEFLRDECGNDEDGEGEQADTLAMWEQARRRITNILHEVQTVYDALHDYGPQPAEEKR